MSKPDPFQLIRESATGHKRFQAGDNDRNQQRKLFSGTDCLPDQMEFFNPNGYEETTEECPPCEN